MYHIHQINTLQHLNKKTSMVPRHGHTQNHCFSVCHQLVLNNIMLKLKKLNAMENKSGVMEIRTKAQFQVIPLFITSASS